MARLFAMSIEREGLRPTLIEADVIRIRSTDESEPGFSVVTIGLGSNKETFFALDGQDSLLERMTMSDGEYLDAVKDFILNDFMQTQDEYLIEDYLETYERFPPGEIRDEVIKRLQEDHSRFFDIPAPGAPAV